MMTPREAIDYFRKAGKIPNPLWLHALDALKHVLKGDYMDTFFKDSGDSPSYLKELQSYLDGKPKEVESFLEARHNAFIQERKWKRFDSECGDLNVDRYLDSEPRPFDDFKKKHIDKPAVTIVMDISVPWHNRDGKEVAKKHMKIYKYACDANKEGRPCRVVGAEQRDYDESELSHHRTLLVLKDFDDPIFPAIWAAFECNRLANAWANAISDYLFGSCSSGNGRYEKYDISKDIEGDIILVEPKTWVIDGRSKDERRDAIPIV